MLHKRSLGKADVVGAITLNALKGGLGNKMLAIYYLYHFMHRAFIDHPLEGRVHPRINVIWDKTDEIGAYFHDIFQPIDNIRVFNDIGCLEQLSKFLDAHIDRSPYHESWWRRMWFLYGPYGRRRLKKSFVKEPKCLDRFYVYTPNADDFFDIYLREDLQDKVLSLTQKFKGKEVVGIHVRHFEYPLDGHIRHKFGSTDFSTSVFKEIMSREVEKDPDIWFYIASDNEVAKRNLVDAFKNRSIYQEDVSFVSRSEEAVQHAAIDMYVMANVSKLFSLYVSSFSLCASLLGNVPRFEVHPHKDSGFSITPPPP